MKKLILLSSCLFLAFLAHNAAAQLYYWDNNGAGTPGNGTWDLSTTNWSSSATLNTSTIAWPNTTNAAAAFSGGATANAPTITLNTAVTAGGIFIEGGTTAVTITGLGSITLPSGPCGFSCGVATGDSITLRVPLNGAGAQVVQEASGSLVLCAASTYSGGTVLTGGQLIYYSNNASFGTGPIIVAGSGNALLNDTSAPLTALTISNNIVFNAPYAINMVSGAAVAGSPGTTWSGNISLPGAGMTTLENANSAVNVGKYTGIISGSGNLTLADAGTIILAGANTYTGTTTIGGLALNTPVQAAYAETPGTSGPFGAPATSANSIIFAGGTLQYSSANTYDYSSRFSTADSQPISIDLNGQNVTLASPLTSYGGTLAVSNTGAASTTLTLSGANTYTGVTTINSNVILSISALADYPGQSAIGYGTVTLNGGSTLTYTGTTTATTSRTFQGPSGAIATINLPNAAGGLNMTGPLRDITGNFIVNKTGPGTLTFSGISNNVSLGLNVLGGTVVLGITDSGPSPGIAAIAVASTVSGTGSILQLGGASDGTTEIWTGTPLTVSNGGVFDVNGTSDNDAAALTLSGAGGGSGALINSLSSSTATISNTITLAASATIGGAGNLILPGAISITNAAYTLTYAGSGTLTVNGVISSNGMLALAGPGTMILGGNNTGTNTTTVNGGLLDIGTGVQNSASGSIQSTNITVNAGTLELDRAVALAPLTTLTLPASPSAGMVNLNFTGIQNVLALKFGGTPQASGFWGAPGTPGATQTSTAFTGSGLLYVPGAGGYSNGFTFSWDPTNTGPTTGASGGTGTWDASSSSWYNGTSDTAWTDGSIAKFAGSNGTVTLNATVTPAAITFATSNYVVTNNPGYSLNLEGTNATSITVTNGINTIACPIIGSSSQGMVVSGPGTLVLSGLNTYTAGTSIASNTTVSVNSLADTGGSLGTGSVTVSNATILYTGTGDTSVRPFVLRPSTTNTIDVPSGVTLTLNGQLNGSSPGIIVSKVDTGTLVIGGTANNAYFGMNIVAGKVILSKSGASAPAAIGNASGIANGAELQLAANGYNNEIYSGSSTPITVSNGGVFDLNGQNNSIYTLNLAGTGNATYDGNTGAVINSASGTTSILTNSSGGSGNVLIASATIGGAGNITLLGPVSIPTTFTLTFDCSGTDIVNGIISGNGGLTQSGSGTLTLNAANTYTNATTVSAGELIASVAGAIGVASPVTVSGGELLASATGAIAATNTVTINGGQLVATAFGAIGSTTSNIVVNGGTLDGNVTGSINTTNITVNNGGVLELDSAALANPLVVLTLAASPANGTVNLNFTGIQNVSALNYGVTAQAAGTYGSSTSGAANQSPIFTGPGILYVVPVSTASSAYWDPTHSGGTGSGGNGSWDNTTTDWTTGSGDAVWTNGNTANFAGSPGTVTVNADVTPSAMTFTTAGYTVTNSGNNTLNLAGTNTPITIPAGTTTIASPIAGAGATATISGPGMLVLSGNNTYDGATTLTNGVTVVAPVIADTGSSSIGLGATFNFGGLNGTNVTAGTALNYTGTGSNATARTFVANGVPTSTINVSSPTGVLLLSGAVKSGNLSSGQMYTKTGPGTLYLGGTAIDNSGATMAINQGEVIISKLNTGSGHGLGGGTSTIASGAELQLAGSGGADLYSGCVLTLANGALLDVNGQSDTFTTLTLAGTGNSSDANAGALINSSTNASTLTVATVLAGTTTIGGNGSITLTGAISGDYGINFAPTNTNAVLTLSTAGTFNGGVVVAPGCTNQINVAAAAGTGPINLGAYSAFNANIAAGTLSQPINGPASAVVNIIETAADNLTVISDMSGFTGTMYCPTTPGGAAKAQINSLFFKINPSATISVASGGTLFVTSSGVVIPCTVIFHGTGNTEAYGALRLSVSSQISGPVILAGTVNTTIGNDSGLSTISGAISGSNGITFTTYTGTIVLSGANTYTGTNILNGCIVRLASPELGASGPLGEAPGPNTIVFTTSVAAAGGIQFTAANHYDYSSRFSSNSTGYSFDENGQTVTFASPITGIANFTNTSTAPQGVGRLILSGANTYYGTTYLAGANDIVQLNAPDNGTGSGPLGSSFAPSSIILAGATLQYTPSNNHDYSYRFSSASTAYNIDVNGQNVTYAIGLAGTGALNLSSSNSGGSLTLAGDNTYSGATYINPGSTLNISGSGSLGFVAYGPNKYAGAINNNGALNFATGSNNWLSGAIYGAGSLTQSGTGLTILSGADTYYGGTFVSAGTLDITNIGTNAASIVGNVTVTGGLLELDNASALASNAFLTLPSSSATLAVNLNFSGTQNISALYFGTTPMPAGTYGAVGSGATYTYAAFEGAGILNVGTSGFYWDPSPSIGAAPGHGGSGSWDLNTHDWTPGSGDIVWNNGNIPTFAGAAGGTVTLGVPVTADGLIFNTANYKVTGSTLTLDSGAVNSRQLISIPAGATEIDSVIASGVASNSVIISGPGTMTLTAANTFTNPIVVAGGTLSFNSLSDTGPSALGPLALFGDGSANTISLYNANLNFTGSSGLTARNVQLNGVGTETFNVPSGGTLEFDGKVGYGNVTAQYGLTFTGGGTLIFGGSGFDNNSLGMNILAGTVIIKKQNSASGHGLGGSPTALAPGAMLQLSGSGNQDLFSGCTLYVSNAAVLDLGGQSDAFTTLYIAGNGTGNGALINSQNTASTISPAISLTGNTTIGGSTTAGDILLTGVISAFDGTESLTYAAPGPNGPTLYLTAANTFSGGLNLNPNSTVYLQTTTAAGTGRISIGAGATLILTNGLNSLNNPISGTSSSEIIVATSTTANTLIGGSLSGFSGTIDCQDIGSGLGGQIVLNNANNEGGPINAAATWKIENQVTLDLATPFTNDPASVQIYGVGGGAAPTDGALRLDACNQQGNVTLEGYNNICWIGSGNVTGPSTISGIISDGGNNNGFMWTSATTPTLILTAVNTYTGPTIVSNGTLALSGSGSIATSSGIYLNNGTVFNVSQTSGTYGISGGQTLANLLGSATINGNLSVASGATLNLTNSASGAPLIVTNGTLTLGGNNPVNISIASAITPMANGFLLIQGTNGGSVAGSVAGSAITLNGLTPPAGITLQIIGGSLYLVASAPVIMAGPNPANPVIYATSGTRTNSITFSGIVFGAPTLTNVWYTNGVAFATNNTFLPSVTLNNVAVGSYTVTLGNTNAYNPPASASTTLTVVAAPTTSFASNVLSLNPFGYWRLNEAGTGTPNNGVVCQDYIHGNDGVYTNASLGNTGYDYFDASLTPPDLNYDAETSAGFGNNGAGPNSCAFGIPTNVDLSAPTNKSATFTIQAWVMAPGTIATTINTPTIAAKGYYNNEEFTLDCGTHIGTLCAYRFTVRNAGATLYSVPSTLIAGNDQNWHLLAGVCDEVNSNISFYIDGTNVGTTAIPPLSGIVSNNYYVPMTIGSRQSVATTNFDQQFSGYINDVALFTNALTASQVQNEYFQAGIAPVITFPNYVVTNSYVIYMDEHATLVLPCYTNDATPPLSLQWYYHDGNLNSEVAIANQTNATLTLSNVTPNVQYVYVVASNNFGVVTNSAPNTFIYLYLNQGSATIQVQPSPSIVYVPAGTVLTYSVVATGADPITYEWILNPTGYGSGINSVISGAINPSYTFTAVTGTNYYQCGVSNVVDGQTSGIWDYSSVVEVIGLASPPAVNFNNTGLWSLQGSGYTPTFNGTGLEMTSSAASEGTTAFYEIPQYIGYGFVASFTYTPSLGSATRADGVAFVVQNSANNYTALGSGGGGLGVVGINPCVNFDMDLFTTAPGGTGINWETNGATAQNGGVANGGTGSVNINSLDPINVVITYAASSSNVNVVLTDSAHPTQTYTTNYKTGNLATMLGSQDAYVGFSGGTGGSYAQQQITGFNFAYTAANEGPVILTDITPTNMDAPAGASITYSPVVIGTMPLYYQWFLNGTNNANAMPGQTNATLTIAAAAGVNTYQLIVSNTIGTNMTSRATVTAATTPFVLDFSNPSLWQLNSNNVFGVNITSGVLALTTAVGNEDSSAYYTVAQYINNGFTASFTYTPALGTSAIPADGVAFVLQNSASGPFALGINGGGAGLGVFGTAPCVNFILDLYSGTTGGTGINWETNGATGLAADGGIPNGPTGSVNLVSGDPINVTIAYQPEQGQVRVTLVDANNTSLTYSTNYQVGNSLGALAGGTSAYVGFTAATGGDNAIQNISNFAFTYAGPAAGLSHDLTPLNFAGYVGNTVNYSVTAIGAPPITYTWLTNGSPVAGAATNSLALVIPAGTTTVQCEVSNLYSTNALGSSTNVLSSVATLTGVAAPTDAYATNLLAKGPIAYWRLNEINGSTTAYDYIGGFNGTYGSQTLNGQNGIPNPPFLGVPMNDLGVFMNNTTASGSSNGFVTTPAMNVTVSNLTITCWVDPAATETVSSGIVFARSGGSGWGINMGAGEEFSYTWDANSATWTWTSGLSIPVSQWSFLALVITPSNATAYVMNTVNGILSSNNNVANAPQLMTNGFNIGADAIPANLPARVFNGEVDEVAIFTNALTSNQVVGMYFTATNQVVSQVQAAFSSLASPSIAYSTASVSLTGKVSGPGSVYPAISESVSASINGHTVNGSVIDTSGDFLIHYNDSSLATDTVGGHSITYAYAGDSGLIGVTNSSATLTITALTHPTITSVKLTGTSLVISATNGTPSGTYRLMTTTNLQLPEINWTPVMTGSFDINGNITLTNIISTNVSPQFFSIQNP